MVEGLIIPIKAIIFKAPHSYTGEDAVELHLPGNPLIARMVIKSMLVTGAEMAEPGEFTARAFFNGKMDLSQAEGVAATIAACNQRQLDAAHRLQSGELTRQLRPVTDSSGELLSLIEAGIDFSEEDIRFIGRDEILERVNAIQGRLDALLANAVYIEQLSDRPRIVLCGRPNAGKSSLLNALGKIERAVVSAEAGTTRDLLYVDIELAHGGVRLIDSAGLEDDVAPATVNHDIAIQMRRLTEQAISDAEVIVLLHAKNDSLPPLKLHRKADLLLLSKCDLPIHLNLHNAMPVSTLTGEGIDQILNILDDLAFKTTGGEMLALKTRHIRLIEGARSETVQLLQDADGLSDELIAEHIRHILVLLGEITGLVTTDDILAKIFGSFCIGK